MRPGRATGGENGDVESGAGSFGPVDEVGVEEVAQHFFPGAEEDAVEQEASAEDEGGRALEAGGQDFGVAKGQQDDGGDVEMKAGEGFPGNGAMAEGLHDPAAAFEGENITGEPPAQLEERRDGRAAGDYFPDGPDVVVGGGMNGHHRDGEQSNERDL